MKKTIKFSFTKTTMWLGIIFSLLTLAFFIEFPAAANFRAGRTIVIHNNTGATLYVVNWTRWRLSATPEQLEGPESVGGVLYNAANISIAPNSYKSLDNFLNLGKNRLQIYPKRVRPRIRRRIWMVNVYGNERRPKELNVYPRDFGKSVMFDSPAWERQTKAAQCNAIVGRWLWFNGNKADFFANNRWKGVNTRSTGSWYCKKDPQGRLNGSVVVVPNQGNWQDTVRVSDDGKSLSGRNQQGVRVTGTRISQVRRRNP